MARILAVEDHPDIADFVKRGLLYHGFEVELVGTDCQGLEVACRVLPTW
jgi:DNA-binding response OmpR family regulator